jgi:hypothetical protein
VTSEISGPIRICAIRRQSAPIESMIFENRIL